MNLGIGGELGYRLLRRLWPAPVHNLSGIAYANKDKVEMTLGPDVYRELRGKTVVDFGCGEGAEAVRIAQRGAAKVIGVDILEKSLEKARENASNAGVSDRCEFATSTREQCDVVISLDSFEHFEDPGAILNTMRELLKPDGYVWASFGPTWYHPYGGHVFSPFPWAHLIFSEATLLRRRADIKGSKLAHFKDIPEGLGQISIRRFLRVVEESGYDLISFEAVPIKMLRPFANRLTREFATSVVRCKLRPAPLPVKERVRRRAVEELVARSAEIPARRTH
jgi:SAM-dependent methyltransferase